VTEEPREGVGAALAAAQQSRRRRASKLAFSKRVWMADQSREAWDGSALLVWMSVRKGFKSMLDTMTFATKRFFRNSIFRNDCGFYDPRVRYLRGS
jgi:hypothetical protein